MNPNMDTTLRANSIAAEDEYIARCLKDPELIRKLIRDREKLLHSFSRIVRWSDYAMADGDAARGLAEEMLKTFGMDTKDSQ